MKTRLTVLFILLGALCAYADGGYFGVTGSVGFDSYTCTMEPVTGGSYDEAKDSGLCWLVGLEYNAGYARSRLDYYNLGTGGSYAAIDCELGLIDPYEDWYDGGLYLGVGGGVGLYLDEGFGVDASATAGIAFDSGMVYLTGGLVAAYVDLGSSGGQTLTNWYLMAGISLGLSGDDLDDLLDD